MKIKNILLPVIVGFIGLFVFILNTHAADGTSYGRYNPGDLIALHYDHAPDRDDGHAAAAGFSVVSELGLNYMVVGGTYGTGNKNDYVSNSEGVMKAVFGNNWLNAHRSWNTSVDTAAKKWADVLKNGKEVLVAEGGQSDFTADVVRKLTTSEGISAADVKRRVIVVQHSTWNENKTNPTDLAFAKSKTTYIRIQDGNHRGNQTAGLNGKSPNFVARAKASKYSTGWKKAFEYLDPNHRLDFSDTVELLHILNIPRTKVDSVDDFGKVFLSGNTNVNTQAVNNSNTTQNTNSNNTSSSGGVNGQCNAVASDLLEARKAFASQCPRQSISDCDPVNNGQWMCSSENIGAASNTNASTNTTINTNTQQITQTNNNVASANTGGIKKGKNGLVVFEAEDVTGPLKNWKVVQEIPGFTAKGHLRFDGNSEINGPADSPLNFSFTPDVSGEYRLMMRIHRRPYPGRNDVSNDGFVRLVGDFSAGNGAPSTEQLKQNIKYYGGHTSWVWNPGAPLDIGHKKYKANYKLTAGKQYTLVLSGRSKYWSVDRIVFAHSSVNNARAQSEGASANGSATNPTSNSTQTSTPPVTSPQTNNNTNTNGTSYGRYNPGDLIALHYDHAPDRDDGHAAAAGFSVVSELGLNYMVVGGTYGTGNKNDYVSNSEGVMKAVFGNNWLNAHRSWNTSVDTAAKKWADVLKNGKEVLVAEGGQSDFTADVVRKLTTSEGISAADVKRRVIVVQHSTWNENKTNPTDLAFAKSKTTYIRIQDGNHRGNQTAGLNGKSPNFVARAKASKYSTGWKKAFEYLDPNHRLDFSDTVELLHILNIPRTKVDSVDDFGKVFLSGNTNVNTQAVNNSNTTQNINSNNTSSSNGGGTRCSVIAIGLGGARNAFSNKCPGQSITDCDPVNNGKWMCSSQNIGLASHTTSSSNTEPTYTTNSNVASANTGGIKKGKNGLVVFEAEDVTGPLKNWKVVQEIPGFTAKGHLRFDGNSEINGPADSPLNFSFTPDVSGEYRLMMRIHRRPYPGRNDVSNDGFVRLVGDFSAGNGAPSTADLKKNQKYYGGHTSWVWNPGAPLDIGHKKYKANYKLAAGKQYTLVLSGRSKYWSVDRIVFAHSSVNNARAQSEGASANGSTQNPISTPVNPTPVSPNSTNSNSGEPTIVEPTPVEPVNSGTTTISIDGVITRESTKCSVISSGLGSAKEKFAQECPNITRNDCDPINGRWVCSSEQIGARTSGDSSLGTKGPEITNINNNGIINEDQLIEFIENDTRVVEWHIRVGSSKNGKDIYDSGSINAETTNHQLSKLPSNTGIHISLYYKDETGTWRGKTYAVNVENTQ